MIQYCKTYYWFSLLSSSSIATQSAIQGWPLSHHLSLPLSYTRGKRDEECNKVQWDIVTGEINDNVAGTAHTTTMMLLYSLVSKCAHVAPSLSHHLSTPRHLQLETTQEAREIQNTATKPNEIQWAMRMWPVLPNDDVSSVHSPVSEYLVGWHRSSRYKREYWCGMSTMEWYWIWWERIWKNIKK